MNAIEQRENDSEDWFRILLDSAPDAMIIVDADGNIARANRQAQAMFGYDREELRGQAIEILLPERFRKRHVVHRAGYARNPQVRPMGIGLDLLARRKNGSEFAVEISLSPVQLGGSPFVYSVIRDVTERKKMEQEIIAARQAAERANKANQAFLAAASHDLRQPVQALSLLNGALRRTVKDERAREMIENQEHSLTAMTNLLNSLLDISRLDAGVVTPEIEDFPVQRFIDRMSAEFSRQARHEGLQFTAEGCPAVVRSDPNLLGEIVQNLISNAIRYTDSGSVKLRCVEAGGHCSIRVEDTGIGIAPDQVDAIFTAFHQLESPASRKEGFGLGLAIVRRLADLLGHTVDVESTPGAGSCFSVKLPTLETDETSRPDDQHRDSASDTSVSGWVVLVEDDPNVAGAWGMLLEAAGYEVATGASVADADALIRDLPQTPVLIISDFHLRDGSTGVDAIGSIRRYFDKQIPAFIVSGDTSKIVKDARLVENCALLSKPVNTNRLLAAAHTATLTGRVPS